jgi:DNA (cytosine-5)-methyltransferase 1
MYEGDVSYKIRLYLEEHFPTSGFKVRRLTIEECALLQSFPKDFEWRIGVSMNKVYKSIGNAVPPLVAKGIGEQLLEFDKNHLKTRLW